MFIMNMGIFGVLLSKTGVLVTLINPEKTPLFTRI